MVTITRAFATSAAAAAVAALGFAGAAQADPAVLNGTYAVVGGDEGTFHWSVVSSCRVKGCTASVASNRGWTSGGRYVNGMLTFNVTKPDGAICSDGRYSPAVISFTIDPATLNGVMAADSNFNCPGGTVSQTPFQLQQLA